MFLTKMPDFYEDLDAAELKTYVGRHNAYRMYSRLLARNTTSYFDVPEMRWLIKYCIDPAFKARIVQQLKSRIISDLGNNGSLFAREVVGIINIGIRLAKYLRLKYS